MPPEVLYKISKHLPGANGVVALASIIKAESGTGLAVEIDSVKRDCNLCNYSIFPTLELVGFPSRSCADSAIALSKRFTIKTFNLILPPRAPGNLDLVADIVKKAKIVKLSLSKCLLNIIMLQPIVQLLPHSELTFLNLYGNHIGDKGALAIANALPGSKLTLLDLGCSNIRYDGTKAIAAALQRSKLTLLNFGGNFPDGKGQNALKDAAAASKVTLRLGDPPRGMQEMSALMNSWTRCQTKKD